MTYVQFLLELPLLTLYQNQKSSILGDPGATSRDDAILSGERHFWRESLFNLSRQKCRSPESHRPE